MTNDMFPLLSADRLLTAMEDEQVKGAAQTNQEVNMTREEIESMNEEETMKFLAEIEKDELWQKSFSVHKGMQLRVMGMNGKALTGQVSRIEDKNGNVQDMENFDEDSARVVIFNFNESGVLHSKDGTPAIEYPGHWEYWDNGLITKVVADFGHVVEHWENGVPVTVENIED